MGSGLSKLLSDRARLVFCVFPFDIFRAIYSMANVATRQLKCSCYCFLSVGICQPASPIVLPRTDPVSLAFLQFGATMMSLWPISIKCFYDCLRLIS